MRDTLVGLSVAPTLLAAAVGVELLTLSPADWYARTVGTNARVCMVAIPLLSLAPLATVLAGLVTRTLTPSMLCTSMPAVRAAPERKANSLQRPRPSK